MEQWALVLADSVLLVVALGGAVFTLVRVRRVGGLAAVLAAAACGVLVVAAVFDMIWWTQVVPNAIREDEIATAANLNKIGVLGTTLSIALGVGLLIAATNVARPAATEPATAPQTGFPAGAAVGSAQPPLHQIPQQYQPHQASPYQPQQQATPQAQPAAGWTPPQQAPGQPDWNIHSGVWSIPRGTFDRPPPDQQQPR
ncbi:hypothetical protein [Virgisporangium aurantiacum]|uniref:Uncharacterized protein n=1 Tax=Virgisporangium aurantiacum TaxID=175570 RepID=A0A8J3YX04_9ACTN|nr:hypothetical protein [Virgisporangium aurantiacum]GIJ53204.1 hypothetical protein Vau01_007200 [Virgisporangium aurantiacum]